MYCASQGYQVSLKSTRGPIDVFLCPESVCSPVAGSSPLNPYDDPPLALPLTKPTDPAQSRSFNTALEGGLSSPASTSSTVTAASQQDPSSLVLDGDTGELEFVMSVVVDKWFRSVNSQTNSRIFKINTHLHKCSQGPPCWYTNFCLPTNSMC